MASPLGSLAVKGPRFLFHTAHRAQGSPAISSYQRQTPFTLPGMDLTKRVANKASGYRSRLRFGFSCSVLGLSAIGVASGFFCKALQIPPLRSDPRRYAGCYKTFTGG